MKKDSSEDLDLPDFDSALSFVEQVKEEAGKQSTEYQAFLNAIQLFSRNEISVDQLKATMLELFSDKSEILRTFDTFLPPRHRIAAKKQSGLMPMLESASLDPEQVFLGTTFTGMGLATMLFPRELLGLSLASIRAEQISDELAFIFRCFGAQATLCGCILLSCTFTARLYRNFGLAILPFFVFDWMAWHMGFLTPFGAIGDGLGNVVFTASSILGYRRKTEQKSSAAKRQ